jgi:hypothetical protein
MDVKISFYIKGQAMKVFENKVLMNIFEPKREKATRGWTKLHNEELQNLYSSLNTIRVIESKLVRWAAHVAYMGEMRNLYKILVGIPEEKRPLGRPRCMWEDEDNSRIDLREIW